MASYIVLEAPAGPNADHSDTKFIADRFSWLALFFPWLWLALHGLWLYAVSVFTLQVALSSIFAGMGYSGLSILSPFAISVLVALEGRNLSINKWLSKGWRMKAAISATSLDLAEQIYYALAAPVSGSAQQTDVQTAQWSVSSRSASQAQILDDPTGIFQFDVKGRR